MVSPASSLITRFRDLLAHPALADASPAVATSAGGLAEIVAEGHTGFTAEPGNPASLAAAILRALTVRPTQRRRLLAQGRSVTAESFDYRANIRSFLVAKAPWALQAGQST